MANPGMDRTQFMDRPPLRAMVGALERALGDRLLSIILYGSAARGEFQEGASDFNLVVVTQDLDPPTLEALSAPIRGWMRRRQPPPRLLTPALIADSIDVYPLEFLDLKTHGVVLHGADPFAGIRVRADQLRLQCERELREKLMRLREGYVEARGAPRALRRLLVGSYTTFAAVFRGCLHLVGETPPPRNAQVAAAFCARAGLDVTPFEVIDILRRGEAPASLDLVTLFSRYYEQLTRAVGAIDRFRPAEGGETR